MPLISNMDFDADYEDQRRQHDERGEQQRGVRHHVGAAAAHAAPWPRRARASAQLAMALTPSEMTNSTAPITKRAR